MIPGEWFGSHWPHTFLGIDTEHCFRTANSFRRQEKAGTIDLLRRVASKGVSVRLLVPWDSQIWKRMQEVKKNLSDGSTFPFYVWYIEPELKTTVSILIVDRKYSLAIEVLEDSKESFHEASGLAIYSSRPFIVMSYIFMFESLKIAASYGQGVSKSEKSSMDVYNAETDMKAYLNEVLEEIKKSSG